MSTLKSVLLSALERYLSRPPALRIAVALAVAGLYLVASPVVETLVYAYLKGQAAGVLANALALFNVAEWIRASAGTSLLVVAALILYATHLSPSVRRSAAISDLATLLANPNSAPTMIQNAFGRAYGYHPDVPVIRRLHDSPRGIWAALDYKYAWRLTDLVAGAFVPKARYQSFERQILALSRWYVGVSAVALATFALGALAPKHSPEWFLLPLLAIGGALTCLPILGALRARHALARLVAER